MKSLLLLEYVIPSLAVGWASHGKAWKLSRGGVWPYAQMLESGVCTLSFVRHVAFIFCTDSKLDLINVDKHI